MSQIVIVSGPPGAGKSSVCEALCQRYDRTVHLETDDIYAWIRMGFMSPWKSGSMEQNLVVNRAAARAAAAFAGERYGVFVDGVIGGVHLSEYLRELEPAGVAVHFAVLLPPVDVIIRRSNERQKQLDATAEMFERVHAMFRVPLPGCTIDNSGMTAEQTADAVMAACASGEALVLPRAG